MKVHKVVNWENGPKGKRVKMVQASFTDETGHHTNHFTETVWLEKLRLASKEPEEELVGYPGDKPEGVEGADVSSLRTDFESA